MSTGQLDPGLFKELSTLAVQSGPFFFALLFIIFVPILGQRWFAAFLRQRTSKGGEREIALEAYAFYWKTGIVTGLILVVVAVWWWIYSKMYYIEIRSTSVFEAVIRGIKDEDDFVLDPGFGFKHYSAYYYRVPDIKPPVIKVAIVFRPNTVTGPSVDLHYLNRQTYAAAKDAGQDGKKEPQGGPLHIIPICLMHNEVQLIHESKLQPPRFDKSC